MKCQRCHTETNCYTMSMFNTQLICLDCKEKEEKREDYKEAVKADIEAIQQGNYNFQGIGLK